MSRLPLSADLILICTLYYGHRKNDLYKTYKCDGLLFAVMEVDMKWLEGMTG